MPGRFARFLIGIAGLVASTLLVSGCASKIDGYSIGDPTCVIESKNDFLVSAWCEAATTFAQAKLDADAPTHAPIVKVEQFGLPPGTILQVHGVPYADGIVVLHLDDKSVHAIGVGCTWGPSGERLTPAGANCAFSPPDN